VKTCQHIGAVVQYNGETCPLCKALYERNLARAEAVAFEVVHKALEELISRPLVASLTVLPGGEGDKVAVPLL